MKAQSVAIQGGLALIGLVGAYATWQREPEIKRGDVVIQEIGKNELQKIRFSDDKKWVELERRKDEDGEQRVWLKLSARPEQKQPERELRGNETSQKLVERFTPMRAARALGVLEAAKLKEVGLDAPKRKLEVTARGETRVYEVGTPTQSISDPYLRDTKTGEVYLFGSSTIADLDAAGVRLVERTLHQWKPNEIESVTITAGGPGGKSRKLAAMPGATPMSVKLKAEKAEKADDVASAWHDKLWRALPTDVLGKGEVPAAGQPTLALRIDYKVSGVKSAFIEMGRVQPPPPPAAASTPDGKPPVAPPVEVYARTESTAGWVKVVSTANDLLTEAEKIAAAE